ncbi:MULTISPECIES: anion transporter [Desulfococcus]|uniref:anion transporter n=1 Tax=Desulfococcus TaxID=896 RepID=UPI000415D30F|nr:anion transporter [Desulfococcus multivorans]AOY59792.1 putative divalent anion transporter [Desulfococcus multivorans]
MHTDIAALGLFGITYAGIALGKVPGLVVDRVGIALLGAIGMVVAGVVTTREAVGAVDIPTILLLYSLMVASAQLRLGGFYSWAAAAIAGLLHRPRLFLLTGMVSSALLSALLANDIVCFAFTPVLSLALIRGGLNPVPFLIGLAVASNIGSAATIIGNPQNMLIGQVGRLDFGAFLIWCTPPVAVSLLGGYLIILGIYRERLYTTNLDTETLSKTPWPMFNSWHTAKGLIAVAVLVLMFFTAVPREVSAIAVAGVLLCSRRMKTRDILGLVDWHLITFFCALFIVIHGVSRGPYLGMMVQAFTARGWVLGDLPVLAAVSTALSNLFSNVPAVMLLLPFLDPMNPVQWYVLAVSSTFAGNLFLLGSIANLIVVEQARGFGIDITFGRHAAVGIPVTLFSLGVLLLWIAF